MSAARLRARQPFCIYPDCNFGKLGSTTAAFVFLCLTLFNRVRLAMSAAAAALADAVPSVVAEFFEVKGVLGQGAFGIVLEAQDSRTGATVAIKLERIDAEFPQLLYETRILQELAGNRGIPKFIWYGYDNVNNILIVERLNCTLEQLRVREGGRLPVEYLNGIGLQALQRLKIFHDAGFAYRDVKPDNFMLKHKVLHIIDYGLCKRVVDPITGVHIPFRTDKELAGTPRYASIGAHAGEEQARRDDIESFVYMMVFLATGTLPWVSKRGSVEAVKLETSVDALCAGLPPAWAATLRYARALEFEQAPNWPKLLDLWR